MVRSLLLIPGCLGLSFIASSQQSPDPVETLAPSGRLWISGQINVITQVHPPFHSAYSGPSSFQNVAEEATTGVATIYTGFALSKYAEVFLDLESAKGAGVSGALGLGGLSNLDAVTDKTASAAPYVARAQLRYVIPLGSAIAAAVANPLGLAASLPERRLEVRIGKMSLTDFFDLNAVGSDSHLQFLNYAIDNNAAYDIAANSRGYTYGLLIELYLRSWAIRYAEAFEPTDNSGLRTDWNLARARSENIEGEVRSNLRGRRSVTLRALAFVNHASMGSYSEAVSGYLSGKDTSPDLTAHTGGRRSNFGWGLNGETGGPNQVRLFGRYGWNQGKREAYQFAEADRTAALGADVDGRLWRRPSHRVGLALAVNALARDHRKYLELGGQSYLLGDHGLKYGREKILEGYYNVPLGHGVFAGLDLQRIWNPGYNRSRGPVLILGLRLHAEAGLNFR